MIGLKTKAPRLVTLNKGDCSRYKYLNQCARLGISGDPLAGTHWIPQKTQFPGKRFVSRFPFVYRCKASQIKFSSRSDHNISISGRRSLKQYFLSEKRRQGTNVVNSCFVIFIPTEVFQFTVWISLIFSCWVRILLYSLENICNGIFFVPIQRAVGLTITILTQKTKS